jgi:DUF2075 family protein
VSSGFRQGYKFEQWFLNTPDDTLSAARLEVAATEFEIHGLELDWICVCWGDDLTYVLPERKWALRWFDGHKWRLRKREEARRHLLNKYRVLLTRARRGMVIWVPRGDAGDPTRDPAVLDQTARFLLDCGAEQFEA